MSTETDRGSEADRILARLAAVDIARPVVDRPAVEGALAEHFRRLGLAPLPVRWLLDATQAGAAAESAAWLMAGRAAWSAAENAAWRVFEGATWGAVASALWRASGSMAWNAYWDATATAPTPGWRAYWRPVEGVASSAFWREVETTTQNTAWRAAWSAAWRTAAESTARHVPWRGVAESLVGWGTWRAAWRMVLKPGYTVPPEIDRWVGVWLPFLDAYQAGLWLFQVLEREVLAVSRPVLRVVADRLHCEDGPAVFWPGGARYYFWRGVQVPEKVVLRPLDLTAHEIISEGNAEVRRVMLERYGPARYLQNIAAECIHQDETGELYEASWSDDEPLVMVRVLNSTPEPDGSRKAYWLRVPPGMRTAREAVAWTFGQRPETYRPTVET